jgi:hypothetical protein
MVRRKKKTPRDLARHACVRAAQRYGIYLDDDAHQRIVEQIQAGQCELIERQSLNRTIWRVTHEGIVMGVVYDKRHKALATLIPPDDPRIRPHDEDERGD